MFNIIVKPKLLYRRDKKFITNQLQIFIDNIFQKRLQAGPGIK